MPSGQAAPPEAVVGGTDNELSTTRFGSVRGYAHRYYGEPRQDAIKVVHEIDDGVMVVAIADGLGTAVGADRGAQCAVEEACRALLCTQTGTTYWAQGVFSQVANRMNEVATSLALTPEDLSTTLAVAALFEGPSSTTVDLALVGDTIPLIFPRDEVEPLPEILDTETAAMPGHFPDVVTTSFEVAPGQTFLLATDGFANPVKYGSADSIVEEWTLQLPQSLGRFLWDIDAIVKTYDDDRTVFAYQRAQVT
nr:protein phosphatase 2C domain-containing protein [Kocuria coralli]